MTVIRYCRCTVHSRKRRPPWTFCSSVANLAAFPQIWACFFVDLRVFLKTCVLLVLRFF